MPTPPLNIVYRPAFVDEVARAASICEDSQIQASGLSACFVAVKDRPVERIVGAAFWRRVPCETKKTPTEAEFDWAVVASLLGSQAEQDFLQAISSDVQDRSPETARLAAATWLPESNPLAQILQSAGFEQVGTRHLFQGEVAAWQKQLETVVTEILPNGFSIVPPASEHFEALKELLCTDAVCEETSQGADRGKQLRLFELARGFQTAGSATPSLFDTRCSGVLLANKKVVGACLANVNKYGHLSLEGLAATALDEDSHSLIAHLLEHTFQGAAELGATKSLSYCVVTTEPTGPLALLADHFPAQPCGTVHHYEIALSAL